MTETAITDEYTPQPSLPGSRYASAEVFELECERIFFRQWMCIGREEEIPNPGDVLVRGFAGESFIITRDLAGELHAFYNVCRHRGTRLFTDSGHVNKVIRCPYHAWTYTLDGTLVGTPNVRADEGFARNEHPLWGVHVGTWAGFVFLNASADPPPLLDVLRDDPEEPLQFERYGIDKLRIGHASAFPRIAADWKMLIDNYNECLHCPTVHPELVALVPVYRKGMVGDDPESWGVPLRDGATSLTMSGRSSLSPLPGINEEDRCRAYGCHVFPNLFIELSSDCVTWDMLLPEGPGVTTWVGGYLFPPNTLASEDFDPSEVVEFGDLVTRQDIEVCERAQLGVGSRAFAGGGVLPYQDRYVHWFAERYLQAMNA